MTLMSGAAASSGKVIFSVLSLQPDWTIPPFDFRRLPVAVAALCKGPEPRVSMLRAPNPSGKLLQGTSMGHHQRERESRVESRRDRHSAQRPVCRAEKDSNEKWSSAVFLCARARVCMCVRFSATPDFFHSIHATSSTSLHPIYRPNRQTDGPCCRGKRETDKEEARSFVPHFQPFFPT